MSFEGLSGALSDSAYSAEGKRRTDMMLVRMDSSWEMVRKTTLSVMCVVLACPKEEHKGKARSLLSGMMGLMSRLCDAWMDASGGSIHSKEENDVVLEESKAVDVDGAELNKNICEFGRVILEQLLATLPPTWTQHFKLAEDLSAMVSKSTSPEDWKYMISLVVEEQRERMSSLVKEAEEAFGEDSEHYESAAKWTQAAIPVFYSVRSGGVGCETAMAESIKALGFPRVVK